MSCHVSLRAATPKRSEGLDAGAAVVAQILRRCRPEPTGDVLQWCRTSCHGGVGIRDGGSSMHGVPQSLLELDCESQFRWRGATAAGSAETPVLKATWRLTNCISSKAAAVGLVPPGHWWRSYMGDNPPLWTQPAPSWGVVWCATGEIFVLSPEETSEPPQPVHTTAKWTPRDLQTMIADKHTGLVVFQTNGRDVHSATMPRVAPLHVAAFTRGRIPVVTLVPYTQLAAEKQPSAVFDSAPKLPGFTAAEPCLDHTAAASQPRPRPQRTFFSSKAWAAQLEGRARRRRRLPLPRASQPGGRVKAEFFNTAYHANNVLANDADSGLLGVGDRHGGGGVGGGSNGFSPAESPTFFDAAFQQNSGGSQFTTAPPPLRKRPASAAALGCARSTLVARAPALPDEPPDLWLCVSGGLASDGAAAADVDGARCTALDAVTTQRLYTRWAAGPRASAGESVLMWGERVCREVHEIAERFGGASADRVAQLRTAAAALTLERLVPLFGGFSQVLQTCLRVVLGAVYCDYNPLVSGLDTASATPPTATKPSLQRPASAPTCARGKKGQLAGSAAATPAADVAFIKLRQYAFCAQGVGWEGGKKGGGGTGESAAAGKKDPRKGSSVILQQEAVAASDEVPGGERMQDEVAVEALNDDVARRLAVTLLGEARDVQRQLLRVHFNAWAGPTRRGRNENSDWKDVLANARNRCSLKRSWDVWRRRYNDAIHVRAQQLIAEASAEGARAVDTTVGWATLMSEGALLPQAGSGGRQRSVCSERGGAEGEDDALGGLVDVTSIDVEGALLAWAECVQAAAGGDVVEVRDLTESFSDGRALRSVCHSLSLLDGVEHAVTLSGNPLDDLDAHFRSEPSPLPSVMFTAASLRACNHPMTLLCVAALFKQWVDRVAQQARADHDPSPADAMVTESVSRLAQRLQLPPDSSASWVGLAERARLHAIDSMLARKQAQLEPAFAAVFKGHAEGSVTNCMLSAEVREVFSELQIVRLMRDVFKLAAQGDEEITLAEFKELLERIGWLDTRLSVEDMHLVFMLCQGGTPAPAPEGAGGAGAGSADSDSVIDPHEFSDAFAILSSFFLNPQQVDVADHLRWFFETHFLPVAESHLGVIR